MKKILAALLCVFSFVFYTLPVNALTYDLIAPTEQLVRGQDVKFAINIDTEGKSLSSTSIGMSYETQYLEYVSTAPGNSFTTVAADVQGTGKLVLTGSSSSAYSGSGVFAYVTFKLIATSAGSTQLCTLYNPQTPTSTPAPTATPVPGQPTSPPAPTALPKTGESKPAVQGIMLASIFFSVAGIGILVFKNT